MTITTKVSVRPDASRIWLTGIPQANEMRAAGILYDALRDWLERQRLVDAGLLPSGVLRPATVGGRGTLAVRGVPIGRIMTTPENDPDRGSTLVLFLPPYVQGTTALEAARELVKELRRSDLAKHAIIDMGGHHGQQAA